MFQSIRLEERTQGTFVRGKRATRVQEAPPPSGRGPAVPPQILSSFFFFFDLGCVVCSRLNQTLVVTVARSPARVLIGRSAGAPPLMKRLTLLKDACPIHNFLLMVLF